MEIFGFKSFGFKNTIVNFDRGLVSISGPNGSGKSNILDSIIFALGENKPTMLRVDKLRALIHDIARYFSNYREGSFTLDDKELASKKIHRLGNVLVPLKSYGPLIEEKMQQILERAYKKGKKEMSTADIANEIGKNLGDNSFLYWAYKNKIPVIVPGIMDGAVGSQIWLFVQKHRDFKLNMLSDADLLSELIFKAKKTGALMIGGGISKHHTLWWNQFRGGLDYALYITTAQEFDGSLSGALVREAISWGKVTPHAKQTTIHAEATTILPFLYSALLSKLKQ